MCILLKDQSLIYLFVDERMRGFENMAHENGPDDGHRNFSVSRRLNRIEVEAVANGKRKKMQLFKKGGA